MKPIIAKVSHIESIENLNIVQLQTQNHTLSLMSLELPHNVKVGSQLQLSIKPTHIALAKDLQGKVSHSNILPAKIATIEEGKLLSVIKLHCDDFELESIITTTILNQMKLREGEMVTILMKASDLSILELFEPKICNRD